MKEFNVEIIDLSTNEIVHTGDLPIQDIYMYDFEAYSIKFIGATREQYEEALDNAEGLFGYDPYESSYCEYCGSDVCKCN